MLDELPIKGFVSHASGFAGPVPSVGIGRATVKNLDCPCSCRRQPSQFVGQIGSICRSIVRPHHFDQQAV